MRYWVLLMALMARDGFSEMPYGIQTVAGSGDLGDGGPASGALLWNPNGVAWDGAGQLYVLDTGHGRLRKIDRSGLISTVARIKGQYLTVDRDGTAWVSARYGIYEVKPDGRVTRLTGIGSTARLGLAQQGYAIGGLARDGEGNLVFADPLQARVVRRNADGRLAVVAGNGRTGYAGDGGRATETTVTQPMGLSIAADGTILVAEAGSLRIRRIDPAGIIGTLAGNGRTGTPQDGPALESPLPRITQVAAAGPGRVLLSSPSSLLEVSAGGILRSLAAFHPPMLRVDTYLTADDFPGGLAPDPGGPRASLI